MPQRIPRLRHSKHRLMPRLARQLMDRDNRDGCAPRFRARFHVGAALLVAAAGLIALAGPTAPSAAAQSVPSGPAPGVAVLTNKVTLPETSIDGPAITTSPVAESGRLFDQTALAWTGTDMQHRLNVMTSTDNVHFTNKLTLNETSPFRPAVAASGGNLPRSPNFISLAWTGTDSAHTLNVLWNVYNAPGSPQKKVTLQGETSIGPPALVEFFLGPSPGGQLFLAWTGTDANHSLNVLPLDAGTLTLGKKVVLPQFSSDAGPNLSFGPIDFGSGNVLVLSWTSRAQRLNLATAPDGSGFAEFTARPDPTIQAELSATAPSANIIDRPELEPSASPSAARSWLAWTDSNSAHNLNLRSTTTFPRWTGPKTVLDETALGGPQIIKTSTFVTRFFVAWTDSNSAHNLNVAELVNT